jgi:hypothetical protein
VQDRKGIQEYEADAETASTAQNDPDGLKVRGRPDAEETCSRGERDPFRG